MTADRRETGAPPDPARCEKPMPGFAPAWCRLPEGHAGRCEHSFSTVYGPPPPLAAEPVAGTPARTSYAPTHNSAVAGSASFSEALDAYRDALTDPPTGEGAPWLNEYQARACPRCAGDERARHIYPACARARVESLHRDEVERAQTEHNDVLNAMSDRVKAAEAREAEAKEALRALLVFHAADDETLLSIAAPDYRAAVLGARALAALPVPDATRAVPEGAPETNPNGSNGE